MYSNDIFEELRVSAGCRCISDLRVSPYKEMAVSELSKIDIQQYPLQQLADLSQYIFGTSDEFDNHVDAYRFLMRVAFSA